MQIFVKTLTGYTLTLEVEPSDTIANLKQRIQVLQGIHPENQHIVTNQFEVCKDDNTLASYNIEEGHQVNLVIHHPSLAEPPTTNVGSCGESGCCCNTLH